MKPMITIKILYIVNLRLRGFLLLLFVQATSAAAPPPASCRSWCGAQPIRFPLGVDAGCGTSELSMSCINYSTLLLQRLPPSSSSAFEFSVVSIDYSTRTLVLSDSLMTDCTHLRPPSAAAAAASDHHHKDDDSLLLTLSPKNTILLLNCSPSSISASSAAAAGFKHLDCLSATCFTFIAECHNHDFLSSCCRVIDPLDGVFDTRAAMGSCGSYTSIYHPKDPIFDAPAWSYGIEMHWSLPRGLADACRRCEAKNGVCGYESSSRNSKKKKKFKCLCINDGGCSSHHHHLCSKMASALVVGFGSVIASISATVCIACLLMRWSCRRRWTQNAGTGAERRPGITKLRFGAADDEDHHLCSSDEPITSETAELLTDDARHIMIMFSYRELEQATGSFSTLFAKGTHSEVYKAEFSNGRILAVKRFSSSHVQNHHERALELFRNEARALSRLNHPGIVKMEGFCTESRSRGDPLLVYENVCSWGKLEHQMHGLPWRERLKVAGEVAEALAYLHFSASPATYHRDVKTSNILLGEGLRAKLANFESSVVAEGFGLGVHRTDLEHSDDDLPITGESDVFGFGVLLLELVYGKKAVDLWRPEIAGDPVASWAICIDDLLKNGAMELEEEEEKLLQEGSGFLSSSEKPSRRRHAYGAADLALRCISCDGRNRPDMKQVSAQLQQLLCSGSRCHGQEAHPEEEEAEADLEEEEEEEEAKEEEEAAAAADLEEEENPNRTMNPNPNRTILSIPNPTIASHPNLTIDTNPTCFWAIESNPTYNTTLSAPSHQTIGAPLWKTRSAPLNGNTRLP